MTEKIKFKKKAILQNVELILKSGDITKLNKPTYEFISLNCGTIAHYSLYGWQETYKDLRDFINLFLISNEYGNNLVDEIKLPYLTEKRHDWYEVAPAEIIKSIIELCEKYKVRIFNDFNHKELLEIDSEILRLKTARKQFTKEK